ncbi:MAG: hypothetical protein EPN91_08790 [Salinibacterium sp.]|nr:MAG: hypothetical protein EPN91_08790 [Salinibacterium sp.]
MARKTVRIDYPKVAAAHKRKLAALGFGEQPKQPHYEQKSGLPMAGPATRTPTAKRSIAKLFVLNRKHDHTGTSGTGIVAEGVRFSNGKVALHWLSHLGAVNVYDSMDVCEVLHGHDGNTVVEWKDEK